jgi:dihydrofolate reductase
MATSVLYMSMSVDGYIAGPDDRPGNPGGDGFDRLHDWGFTPDGDFHRTGPAGDVNWEILATGAVLTGRRTAEQAEHWGGDHHGVPMIVLSRHPAPVAVADNPMIRYVSGGIEAAMAQAKAAAGDRDVMVHGAATAQQALEAGVLDEIQLHLIPVLFGRGRRLFDVLPAPIELDVIRAVHTPEATHLRYRIRA